jgi:GntR family transcriptional regulator
VLAFMYALGADPIGLIQVSTSIGQNLHTPWSAGRGNMDETPIWDQIVVDRRAVSSPFVQIVNAIRHKIATHQLAPNTPMPSVRALAEKVGVTPPTVARAYRQLQADGLIESHVGVGTVVSDTRRLVTMAQERSDQALDHAVERFVADLQGLGHSTEMIRQSLERHLTDLETGRVAVIVAETQPVADKYVTLLARELEYLDVRVEGLLLRSLETHDDRAEELMLVAARVLTALGNLKLVQRAVNTYRRRPPISVVFTELSPEAIEQVSSVEPSARVLMVTEERYRGSLAGVVQSYLPTTQLEVARFESERELEEMLGRCDVVIFTLGLRERLTPLVDERHKLILMEYQLRPDALLKLRDVFDRSREPTLGTA